MANSDFLLNILLGVLLVGAMSTGLTFIFLDLADNYDVSTTNQGITNNEAFEDVNALVDDINDNLVGGSGAEGDDSRSLVVLVGWDSLKLMLQSPGILKAYLETLSNSLEMSFNGIDFIGLIITIVIIVMLFILIMLVFVGRA